MKKFFATLFLSTVLCVSFAPILVLAQSTNYDLLAPLPLTGPASGDTGTTNAGTYLEGIFRLIIAIAGVLAVIMIIYGGIKYISSEAFSGKGEAKTIIQNAVLGLILAIASYLILYTINPDLLTFNLSITPQQLPAPYVSGGGGVAPSANCPNCVILSVRHKPPPLGCSPVPPQTSCTIAAPMNQKLMVLQSLTTNLIVNESFPPTTPHADPCHANGTCVDIGLPSGYTPKTVNAFLTHASNAGLSAVYEVPTAAEKNTMVAGGVPASSIIVVPLVPPRTKPITPHFSVK